MKEAEYRRSCNVRIPEIGHDDELEKLSELYGFEYFDNGAVVCSMCKYRIWAAVGQSCTPGIPKSFSFELNERYFRKDD